MNEKNTEYKQKKDDKRKWMRRRRGRWNTRGEKHDDDKDNYDGQREKQQDKKE